MSIEEEKIPVVLVRSVMRLYDGAKTRVGVDCKRSLGLKWGCTKDLCCHLLFLQLR